MSRAAFINDLVQLLVLLDRGIVKFREPLPDGVGSSLADAVRAFDQEALPFLHAALVGPGNADPIHVIDVLRRIRHPSSATPLIAFYEQQCSNLSSLVAIRALRELRTEQAYLYIADLLARYVQGETNAFEGMADGIQSCKAMGEWRDKQAVSVLIQVINARDDRLGLRGAARAALDKYQVV